MMITRHYLTVGNRRVHYRRAGQGPAIVLLHASPVSSEVFEEVHFPVLAKEFTVIAIDTPGQGFSDRLELGRQEQIADLADALAETLEILGVEHCALYGRHTGASIAVEYARRFPKRASLVITDGFPLFSAEVRDEYLKNYLAEIVPDWAGSHLLWWWFRYREQHVFWPWNKHEGANRADQDVPNLDFLQRGTREILVAGNSYQYPYAAAFAHDGIPCVHDIIKGPVPVCFGGRPGDSVFPALERMPKKSWVKEFKRDKRDAAMEELEIFRQYPAKGEPPSPPDATDLPDRVTIRYVAVGGGQVALRSAGDHHPGAPVILLHQFPGSGKYLENLLLKLGTTQRAIAIDLPGHGDSDPATDHSVLGYAATVADVFSHLRLPPAHIYGHNAGASVAIALAIEYPAAVASVMLEGPMVMSASDRARFGSQWALPADPVWDGHHLTTIWHQTRDKRLYYPWYEKTLIASRFIEPGVSPEATHNQVVQMIKHPSSFKPAWDAAFAYPTRERLSEVRVPMWIGVTDADDFAPCRDATERLLDRPIEGLGPVPSTKATAKAIQKFLKTAG
jgi:pimeloyl-ACP methyl ester carboxylesterase